MIPTAKVRNPGSKKYLFTYGSLLPSDVFELLLGKKPSQTPNKLRGYSATKIYVGTQSFPTLIESKSTGVANGFTTKINAADLDAIDNHFSYTKRHSRVLVKLANDIEAWTYIVSNVSPDEVVEALKEAASEVEKYPSLRVTEQLSGIVIGLEITSES